MIIKRGVSYIMFYCLTIISPACIAQCLQHEYTGEVFISRSTMPTILTGIGDDLDKMMDDVIKRAVDDMVYEAAREKRRQTIRLVTFYGIVAAIIFIAVKIFILRRKRMNARESQTI
jgi:hypothetical protein